METPRCGTSILTLLIPLPLPPGTGNGGEWPISMSCCMRHVLHVDNPVPLSLVGATTIFLSIARKGHAGQYLVTQWPTMSFALPRTRAPLRPVAGSWAEALACRRFADARRRPGDAGPSTVAMAMAKRRLGTTSLVDLQTRQASSAIAGLPALLSPSRRQARPLSVPFLRCLSTTPRRLVPPNQPSTTSNLTPSSSPHTAPTSAPAPSVPKSAVNPDAPTAPVTEKKQAEADWKIILKIAENIWPRGATATKVRVLAALALLVGGKVLNVQVPFFFKQIVDSLNVEITAETTVWVLAGASIAGCKWDGSFPCEVQRSSAE
jgi:hypothetical protein